MLTDSSPDTNVETILFEDKDALSCYAAERFIELAASRHRQGLPFTVALAGGSTPEAMYAHLAATDKENAEIIDWNQVFIFFGDERCVSPDAPESNFRLAQQTMFSQVELPAKNILRMPAELPDHDEAARQYAATLRSHFALTGDPVTDIPHFDLILLGLGSDGHTASLFPHMPALLETKRLVVATAPGLKPFVPRLTLTYPVLNNAADVIFLVAGEDKADTLSRVLEGPLDKLELPAQNIIPKNGKLTWLVDSKAASRLSTSFHSKLREQPRQTVEL